MYTQCHDQLRSGFSRLAVRSSHREGGREREARSSAGHLPLLQNLAAYIMVGSLRQCRRMSRRNAFLLRILNPANVDHIHSFLRCSLVLTEFSMSATAEESGRRKRPRALQACDVCRTRKQRCDERFPCTYCAGKFPTLMSIVRVRLINVSTEHDLECTYPGSPQAKRPRQEQV
jgi:hypothetical protein